MTICDEIQTDRRAACRARCRIVLFFVMQSVAALVVGFAALFLSFEPVWSAETRAGRLRRPGDARSGSLLLKTEDGYADATRLGIDVDLTVSGPTIRARVTQIFRNPTQNWVEAIYVYPLPAGGAVDTLKMVIGDRVMVGDIKERQQAKIIYEQAARNGQKAALTEQERPNIFTNSVANIGPGETVLVQIEYQEPVQQSGNEFSLRVPMVVGPRYNPAPVVQSVDFRPDGGGWGATKSDPVPDRDRISPEVLDPATNAPVNPTSITVHLQAGFPLGEVKSHHHAIKTESPDHNTRIIKLAEGPVPRRRFCTSSTPSPVSMTAPPTSHARTPASLPAGPTDAACPARRDGAQRSTPSHSARSAPFGSSTTVPGRRPRAAWRAGRRRSAAIPRSLRRWAHRSGRTPPRRPPASWTAPAGRRRGHRRIGRRPRHRGCPTRTGSPRRAWPRGCRRPPATGTRTRTSSTGRRARPAPPRDGSPGSGTCRR